MHLKNRKSIFLLLFAMSNFNSIGQGIYTYNACSNILYRGITNILYVDFCEQNDSVFLLADNGIIERLDSTNNFQYIWSSAKDTPHDTTHISLYNIIQKDTVLIGVFLFKIHDIPLPLFF